MSGQIVTSALNKCKYIEVCQNKSPTAFINSGSMRQTALDTQASLCTQSQTLLLDTFDYDQTSTGYIFEVSMTQLTRCSMNQDSIAALKSHGMTEGGISCDEDCRHRGRSLEGDIGRHGNQTCLAALDV